jgi:uncharacterized protein YraI
MKQFSQKRWVVAFVLVLLLVFGSVQATLAQFAVPTVVVNTSFLNIRTGPGVQYTVLVTVVGGTELPVLAVGSDQVWYLVSTPVGIGWVNVEFTLPRGDFSVAPTINVNAVSVALVVPAAVTTIALPTEGQAGGAVSASSTSTIERFRAVLTVLEVNLRSAPRDDAPALSILRAVDDRLTDYAVVGRASDDRNVAWVAIDVPNIGVGWVEEAKVFIRLSARYATVYTVTATEFGVTTGPAGGALVEVVNTADEVFLVGSSTDTLYAQVELGDGRVGWLPFSVIAIRTGTTSDIARANGDTRENLGQGGGESTTTLVFPTLELPHIIVNTSFLNIRSGPGGNFSVLATVSGGDELDVIGISRDGFWYLVSGGFGSGWLDSDFVIFRGNAGNVPVVSGDVALIVTNPQVQTPVANFSTSLTLYAAPGVNFGAVGFVNGPAELPIVARTADGQWIQLNTPVGFGWVLASQVVIRGDQSLIPVIP